MIHVWVKRAWFYVFPGSFFIFPLNFSPAPEYPAYLQSDEWRTERFNTRLYPANVNPDNTLTFDEVFPGDYELKIFVNTEAGTNFQLTAATLLTVPAESAGATLDAGTISLNPISASPLAILIAEDIVLKPNHILVNPKLPRRRSETLHPQHSGHI